MTRLVLPLLLAAGCWDGERSELPRSTVDFEPQAGAIDGWVVTEATFDLA
ncbi:MAG: hypothetical protein KC656_12290 [Myxococcales bacterium]|nr:hypothetical protein [Myxococcales bacterium]